MEADTKEAILMENVKEMEYTIGIMEQYIKGSSKMPSPRIWLMEIW
jgi:hypothetical protein